MVERTANQALATWAELEYETRKAWAKTIHADGGLLKLSI